jgi:hypothetical protein
MAIRDVHRHDMRAFLAAVSVDVIGALRRANVDPIATPCALSYEWGGVEWSVRRRRCFRGEPLRGAQS